jgi:hypothetical protein
LILYGFKNIKGRVGIRLMIFACYTKDGHGIVKC